MTHTTDDTCNLTSGEICDLLMDAVDYAVDEGEMPPLTDTVLFSATGVLSNNDGFTLRIAEAEYQVTVVRSK